MSRESVVRNSKAGAALIHTERKMLEFIAWRINQYGYQPSMREIATELGYASPGYVPTLVESCRQKGVVVAQHGARAIEFDWRAFV